jgi:positive phototaxis protein PixI
MLGNKQQISQFLSFNLTSELQAMLPTAQLAEIASVDPSQIVPIFELPTAVMGVYNRRGEVLWIVDLAYLLDLEAIVFHNLRHYYNLLILQRDREQVGLAVRQVGQLILCPDSQILPLSNPEISDKSPLPSIPPRASASKLSFCLRGEKRQPDGKRLWVLDGDKILDLLKNSTF